MGRKLLATHILLNSSISTVFPVPLRPCSKRFSMWPSSILDNILPKVSRCFFLPARYGGGTPDPGLKGFLVVDNVDKLCLLRLHYKDDSSCSTCHSSREYAGDDIYVNNCKHRANLLKLWLSKFMGINKYNLPVYAKAFQFLHNDRRLDSYEKFMKILSILTIATILYVMSVGLELFINKFGIAVLTKPS